MKDRLWSIPTIKEVHQFWVDETLGIHDDWPDEWLPKWLQLDFKKYGGLGQPLGVSTNAKRPKREWWRRRRPKSCV